MLSGFDRPGAFAAALRTERVFLRDIVSGIRAEVPGLGIGVRVSVFDFVPFQPGPTADEQEFHRNRIRTATRLAAMALALELTLMSLVGSWNYSSSLALISSAQPVAALITTLTFSDPRCFHRAMVTSRRKIRWWECIVRSWRRRN